MQQSWPVQETHGVHLLVIKFNCKAHNMPYVAFKLKLIAGAGREDQILYKLLKM